MKSEEASMLINVIAGCFHSMSESALSAQIKEIIYSFVNDGLDECPFCGEEIIRFKFGVSLPDPTETNPLSKGHYIECQDCAACTTHYITKEAAIKAWNATDVYGEDR
jgi:Lar family restriction alleviation protein